MYDFLEVMITLAVLAFFGVVLVFLIALPISQLETRSFVKQFEQTEETVEVVRAKGEMPEADIMIEANQYLAKYKYYNNIPIIGWCSTDQVDDLQPIE